MKGLSDSSIGKRRLWPVRVWQFYYEGFSTMGSTGRKLWALILIKLAIMFLVLKIFFFPDLLSRDYDNDADRSDAVRNSLLDPRRQ